MVFLYPQFRPLSRRSAKPFLQSSELGLAHPLSLRRVCPPPFGPGGDGLGESQFRRGDNIQLWCYIKVLCDLDYISLTIINANRTVLGSEVWKRRCLASVEERANVLPHVVHV
jgi:hypothetical protein